MRQGKRVLKFSIILLVLVFLISCKSTSGPGTLQSTPITVDVYCYNLCGNVVSNAQVIFDGETYASDDGRLTLLDVSPGTHTIDFTGNVWDEWLFVRETLNGYNIQQKDIGDLDSSVNISSNMTLYLIKIHNSWDMDRYRRYLGQSGDGLHKFTGNTIPVVVQKKWNGDTAETERMLTSNLNQMNNAQIRGELNVRQKFEILTSAYNPKIDVIIREKAQYSHGERLSGYEITNSEIKIPGKSENVRFSFITQELFECITHTDNEEYDRTERILDGEQFKDILNRIMVIWANSDPGTRFFN